MAYGESNGYVTEHVTWPRKVKLVTPIRFESNISKTAGDAISNNRLLLDSLLRCSTVSYPSDSLLQKLIAEKQTKTSKTNKQNKQIIVV